jgi:hypothetical protein
MAWRPPTLPQPPEPTQEYPEPCEGCYQLQAEIDRLKAELEEAVEIIRQCSEAVCSLSGYIDTFSQSEDGIAQATNLQNIINAFLTRHEANK